MTKQPVIVAYGGGINSTALLIGMKEKEDRPDLILMANTGGEKPETLAFLGQFAAWLRDNNFPELQIVQNTGMYKTLENNCVQKNMLPSLAYGFKSCSDKYKRRPQDKFCNNWQPAKDCWRSGKKCFKYIGYDADETRRAKKNQDDKYIYHYPLIDWGWGRDECVDAIKRAGLNIPPKSSCFFCPAMTKNEVIDLKHQHPDLFKRALDMEKGASENLKSVKGLGRRWAWSEVADADDNGESLARFTDSFDGEPCGCYDGDYEGIHETVVELTSSVGCKIKREI